MDPPRSSVSVQDGALPDMASLAKTLEISLVGGMPSTAQGRLVVKLECLVEQLLAVCASPSLARSDTLLDKR